ncbi:ATP-dependent RNA helicase DbpA [Thiospirochaeta perfilievii]|uniref:ATP-dependent RNA helicase DbpA n=1 Tax=Thiospirochaeta perfilievii TaxID=252967 RepID=A0A5C1Q8M1_9SPIO|nr:ATP-dependent RNA helicase DbpA [Thiospirochaeta perfilievii]QEN03841.1 ATP-dependent RNA helicase DbpA [Thiospirochaeta perfilievii]
MNSFETLSISKGMVENLNNLEYKQMTPIQEKSIPIIIEGRDIIAKAKTGSGKTAAFGIGILEKLNVKKFRVQSLVLCPTRELAEQVTAELRKLARFKHNIKILKLTGGIPLYKQEGSLFHEAHIVVGTPGRILKLLERGSLNLDHLKNLVLDEADRMLDMGFSDEINAILDFLPQNIQTLCFSATFASDIKLFTKKVLNDPVDIEVESTHTSSIIEQKFYFASKDRVEKTVDIIKNHNFDSIIVFCNTKETCKSVVKELNKSGVNALTIHGDLEQKDRNEVLVLFSNGSSRVLVATDVAARGLDIGSLSAVINYDMPFETETYVHRIGRTGRAGKSGNAFSFITSGEEFRLDAINEYMNLNHKCEEFIYKLDKLDDSSTPWVTISINGGRKNKISPGDILGALTSNNGIAGSDVGKIDRQDYITFVAIKREVSQEAFNILSNETIKGKRFKVIFH